MYRRLGLELLASDTFTRPIFLNPRDLFSQSVVLLLVLLDTVKDLLLICVVQPGDQLRHKMLLSGDLLDRQGTRTRRLPLSRVCVRAAVVQPARGIGIPDVVSRFLLEQSQVKLSQCGRCQASRVEGVGISNARILPQRIRNVLESCMVQSVNRDGLEKDKAFKRSVFAKGRVTHPPDCEPGDEREGRRAEGIREVRVEPC